MHLTTQGQYDNPASYQDLNARLAEHETSYSCADRLFYLSIPPTIFTAVARYASEYAMTRYDMCVFLTKHLASMS